VDIVKLNHLHWWLADYNSGLYVKQRAVLKQTKILGLFLEHKIVPFFVVLVPSGSTLKFRVNLSRQRITPSKATEGLLRHKVAEGVVEDFVAKRESVSCY